jgi:hypothetical protein
MGPGGQTAPSSPTAWATMAAVAGASPVTMTVRTPRVRSSEMSEQSRCLGGSLRAMNPISCMDAAVPQLPPERGSPAFRAHRLCPPHRARCSKPGDSSEGSLDDALPCHPWHRSPLPRRFSWQDRRAQTRPASAGPDAGLCESRGANSCIDGVLASIGTRERCHAKDVGFVKARHGAGRW